MDLPCRRNLALLVAALVLAFAAPAQTDSIDDEDPMPPEAGGAAPPFLKLLPQAVAPAEPGWNRDGELQRQLDRAVEDLGLESLIHDGRLGIALVDLSTPGTAPRLAEVNGATMMYAASVPKIAVLYAAFQAVRDGRLTLDAGFRETLTDMIRVSSNQAASAAIARLGFNYINALLWQSRLYDPSQGGGLWLGKAYGGQRDHWHRDPMFNISHGATALSVASLLTLIAQDKLIDARASREMKDILGDPGLHHKFVRGLDARPGSHIFRKSGSWRQWHGDAALIERDDKRYVAVALCEDAAGGEMLEKLIVALDDCVCPAKVASMASLDSASLSRVR